MDAYECVATKLDVRDFGHKEVPSEVRLKVLEAGRLTGSGINSQHWHFILVQDREHLKTLARDSTTGGWAANANFAVIIVTNPKYGFHLIDAGRAAQDMQIAAWNYGVISCVFTGFKPENLRRDFQIPDGKHLAIVVGFGYPTRRIIGKKSRRPLSEIASLEMYGKALDLKRAAV